MVNLTQDEINELDRRGFMYDGHVTNGSSHQVTGYVQFLIDEYLKMRKENELTKTESSK